MRRALTILMALVLAFAVAACGDDDDTSGTSTATTAAGDGTSDTSTVVIESTSYDPAALTVQVGTTVTWVHRDGGLVHTTSSAGGEWDSGDMNEGDEFTFTFDETGAFTYFCQFHPGQMTGSITVVDT